MDSLNIDEVAKKLGLDQLTVINMCIRGRFPNAFQNENGDWLIPKSNFITTREQDERAEEVLRQIDRKNRGGRDETEIPYISAKAVSDFYQVRLEKVENWIKEGYLSGKQIEGDYFVPKEEFEYLKARRDSDTLEEELKNLLGEDFINSWDVEIEE
ncbi:MerR family transcriptional regulator [Robertmurraya massiliosenegalensis]|uniref:hypothetical protein n=1 Tax=Robertmurraya massiliosenegalensis TaxID=1287657 RepID=UPI0003778EAC|nr:hypothetical protein [Robertmurraya massiliosenegalensis]